MLRLFLALVLILALPAQGATRWFSERVGEAVEWSDWGRGATDRARAEKKPLFLSIGFASSYDCFRMQREAFADPQNAAMLNAHFVPVVLDRIEHPEVAEAYERALHAMNGAEGWPANLVLTPSLAPFDGGGFMDAPTLGRLLVTSANRWKSGSADADARAAVEKTRATAERHAPLAVDLTSIEATVDAIAKSYERTKLFDPLTASFLLRYSARANHAPLRELALETLRNRAASRLRDQLGGGVHRCETCFDKLLRDQAVEALVYLDAYDLTREPDFAYVARTTLDYALRDLRLPRNALFEAAQDSHSLVPVAGAPRFVDGAFYLWSKDEVTRLLSHDDAGKVFRLYAMKDVAPNRLALDEPRFLGETYDELAAPLQKMLDVRQKRPAPFREPLAVAGWNGLMISALARFGEPKYVDAAQLAAVAVSSKLWDAKKATLARTDSGAPALAEDYALLVQGFLDLYEASYDVRWLELARTLQQKQDAHFWDASAGRYRTGTTLPESMRGLLVESDEELPSVNAVSATNLLRLTTLLPNETWAARPAMIFHSFGGRLRTDGARVAALAAAYELSLLAPSVVVVTGAPRGEETHKLISSLRATPDPRRAIVLLPNKGPARERVTKVLPFTAALESDPEKPIAYSCAKGECRRQ